MGSMINARAAGGVSFRAPASSGLLGSIGRVVIVQLTRCPMRMRGRARRSHFSIQTAHKFRFAWQIMHVRRRLAASHDRCGHSISGPTAFTYSWKGEENV